MGIATQQWLGQEAIGSSDLIVAAHIWYLKQITAPSDGLLAGVAVHTSQNGTTVDSLQSAV